MTKEDIAFLAVEAQDACNPRAIARTLVQAIDYACTESKSSAGARGSSAVFLIMDKLASMGLYPQNLSPAHSMDSFSHHYNVCTEAIEEKREPDNYPCNLEEVRPSILCRRDHIQNCHFCDDIECCDNTSRVSQELKKFREDKEVLRKGCQLNKAFLEKMEKERREAFSKSLNEPSNINENKDLPSFFYLSNGEEINLAELDEEETKFLETITFQVETEELSYPDFFNMIHAAKSKPLKGKDWMDIEIFNSPLYRICRDLALQLGIKQGFIPTSDKWPETDCKSRDFFKTASNEEFLDSIIKLTRRNLHLEDEIKRYKDRTIDNQSDSGIKELQAENIQLRDRIKRLEIHIDEAHQMLSRVKEW